MLNLNLVRTGDQFEEDHARANQLIVNDVAATTGAIDQFKRDGKTFVRVMD